MSERVVCSCDICGKDYDDRKVLIRFYGSTQGSFRDVGPCCLDEPIKRLRDCFKP